jgi:homoserine dehydrogenase
MVPYDSALAQVDGVLNAVSIDADLVRSLLLVGPGAGGDATASAVVADLVDIARGHDVATFGKPATLMRPYEQAAIAEHEGGYYIRLAVFDRPGALAGIATRMAAERISLESIVQRGRAGRGGTAPDAPQPVILITYETTEAAIRRALDAIEADGHIAAKPQMIRIEKL